MGDTVLGPIDYLAVGWPGRHVTGEGFRLLMDLVDRGIVGVLDFRFISKDADGTASTVEAADVEHSDELDALLWALSSGLLDSSDIDLSSRSRRSTRERLIGSRRRQIFE